MNNTGISDHESIRYPSGKVAWLSTFVIFIITVIAMADRFAISMLIGPIKEDLGLGDFKASLLVGVAFSVFYALFLIPIGWLADRFSRVRVLLVCLAIWSLTTMLCGLATGFVMLFILRMLVGAGEAGLAPSAHGIIGSSFPREKMAKPIALQGIGIQIGGAVGIFSASAILSLGQTGFFEPIPMIGKLESWRIAFIIIGLPGIIAMALVPFVHDPSKALSSKLSIVSGNTREEGVLAFFRSNILLVSMLLIGGGFASAVFGGVVAWAPEFLIRQHQTSPLETGSLVGGIMLFSAIFSQSIYSSIVDWFSARGMLDSPIRIGVFPVACALPVAYFAFSVQSKSLALIFLFLLLFCLTPCAGMFTTTFQQISPPAFRSRLASIMVLVISIVGFGIGPTVVGLLSEYVYGETRLAEALLITSLCATVIALICLVTVMKPLRSYIQAKEASIQYH